jgi:carboxypeptidase Q
VTPYSIRSPHTGTTRYDSTVAAPRIPIAALTVEDAALLHRMQDQGDSITVRLIMGARTLPDTPSRNVMAEVRGSERPEEVVLLGGHIDSWDVGTGAMDDAGGVVAAWEAIRLIQRMGLKPRRTIRAVGWTNEENGLRGGLAYRDARGADVAKHVLAIESDGGSFQAKGFSFAGSDSALGVVRRIATLLTSIGADSISSPGGGADIGPLMQLGVPGMGLETANERYFWYHHSQGDTLDKIDPGELASCVAAMAVMAYVVADLPERLPR